MKHQIHEPEEFEDSFKGALKGIVKILVEQFIQNQIANEEISETSDAPVDGILNKILDISRNNPVTKLASIYAEVTEELIEKTPSEERVRAISWSTFTYNLFRKLICCQDRKGY
jgi:hypothetical protein